MESFTSKQNDYSSTKDSPSVSLDKSGSKSQRLSETNRTKAFRYKYLGNRNLKFMNNSFRNQQFRFPENNCEIVLEEELEQTEEHKKKLRKIIPIFDKREDLLFDHPRSKSFLGQTNDRSRSSEVTLPKVIESKEEYSCFYDKPKHKFSNYLALVDKTEKFNFMAPKVSQENKEEQLFDSKNAIEEVNPCEEDFGINDEESSENRSYSVKSGSISRISNNSFIKKRIVDECVIFDREKEMSEIVG